MITLEEIKNQQSILEKKEYKKIFNFNIKKIYIFQFFIGFYFISGVIIPFYLVKAHLTLLDYNILQGYYYLLIFILEIPCGLFADYYGKKKSLILASFFSMFGAIIYGLWVNIFIFYIGESFFAIGAALMSGTTEALLHDSLKIQKKEKSFTKTVGKSNNIFLIGIIISSPLGSIIGYFISLQLTIVLMSVPYGISLIIALTLKDVSLKKRRNKIDIFKKLKNSFKPFMNHRILKILIKEILFIEIIIFSLYLNYQFFLLIDLKISLIYLGIIEALIILSEIIFTYIISLKKIIHSKIAIIITTFLIGFFYISLGILSLIPINIIIIIIVLGLGLSRYIFFLQHFNKELNIENRALCFSVFNMIKMIPGMILPIIGLLFLYNFKLSLIIMGSLIVIFVLLSRNKYKKD